MKPATNLSQAGEAFLIGDQIVKINSDNAMEIRSVTLPPTNPPAPGTPLATSTTAMYAVYADSSNLYYSLSGTPATVLWKPLDGSSAAKTAVTMPASVGYPTLITGNTTALYMVSSSPSAIYTAPRPTGTGAGATAGLLHSGLTGRATIYSLALVGTRLFWSEASTPSAVYSAPLSGTPITTVDDTVSSAYYVRIVSDGAYAYWNTYNGASSAIRRVSAAATPSPTAVQEIAVGLNSPGIGLAVDEAYVYYFSQYEVYRVAKDGSEEPESLGNLNRTPWFYNLFAVDDQYVYGTGYYGEIVRISKIPSN
jgi:hypothetical protein